MTTTTASRRETYARAWVTTAGELGVVGGAMGWALGWRFGHLLVTLSLVTMIAGMWVGRLRPRRSVASSYVVVGRHLKSGEAVDLARKAAHHYRKYAAKYPADGLLSLAGTLDWHRSLLRELGRYEEAEPVAREAVETWREVVTTDASRRENLSKALNHLTVTLDSLKRHDEVLSLTEEAVVIQRSVVATQNVVLALHLQNLAMQLRRAEQWEPALPIAEEAASLYRRLVPDAPDLLEEAADTAQGLALTLRELDRQQESLEVTREWIEYERALVARQPERRPQLADALRVLGSREANLDLDPLTHWRASLETWRQLVSESDEYRSAYADACALIGRGLTVVGETNEALTVLREGLHVRRTLAALDSHQYDELLDDLAHAAHATEAPEFAAEAVTVVREHGQDVTADVVLHAVELLRGAGFSAEAEKLQRE